MMAEEVEPPCKRSKIMEEGIKTISQFIDEGIYKIKNSTNNLTPIISEQFTDKIPYTEVYIAVIKNQKDTSKAILALNEKCPLKDLQHLKRVHKKEIIIAKMKSETENIKEFINQNLDGLSDIFEDYKTAKVPAVPPKLKWQFEECNKIWPCNFHPNKYNENLFGGSFFDNDELSTHRKFMEVVFEVLRIKLEDKLNITMDDREFGATVVVDPAIRSIVAVSFDNRTEHPLQHAAMLAIDNVARTQTGGSWNSKIKIMTDGTVCGIDEDVYSKLERKFPDLNFGAKEFKSKTLGDGSEHSGPYLCTGYYVYTLNEPCLMCSMGLVHSRAKRVFFCYNNEVDGALKSKAKLQTIASLNHHFEVFTGFL